MRHGFLARACRSRLHLAQTPSLPSVKVAPYAVTSRRPKVAACVRWLSVVALAVSAATTFAEDAALRIMPPDRSTLAVGQRFDIRVETATESSPDSPLRAFLDGAELSDAVVTTKPGRRSITARNVTLTTPGDHVLEARLGDTVSARVRWTASGWDTAAAGTSKARNVILMIGDGMGSAHRTAARLVTRGLADGRARGRLAMDTLEVTGLVMTSSLNSVITDSAPGMSSLVTGAKGNNNQEGVFPDDTPDPFDNPRIEYLGELLRRSRGPGFHVGLVTTADLTDATPAGNVVHTSDRNRGADIAARMLDDREASGLSVLLGGGARNFVPRIEKGSTREDGRDLLAEFGAAGFATVRTASELRALGGDTVPQRILGLFHPGHMSVAFDKVGAGRYSDELSLPKNETLRDQPMLPEMARVALASLSAHSPGGFYLMIEGASIDKRAHDVDAERTIWDVIEFDQAVAVALEFVRKANADSDPDNDTLLVVTADHECGGLAIIGVGNARYAPEKLGFAARDYASVFRFQPEQLQSFVPNYAIGTDGYPAHPDPSRKLLLGWAAGPDHFENWVSNRRAQAAAFEAIVIDGYGSRGQAVANRARDGVEDDSDNRTVEGVAVPGFLVGGTIENGETGCRAPEGCPGDTAASAHTIAGHTATDVPLSATGPGAFQFTGTYENTDVFLKILRSTTGSWSQASPSSR